MSDMYGIYARVLEVFSSLLVCETILSTMNILSNISMMILLIISNEFYGILCKSQDDICPKMYGILCVKDVLQNILSASNEIDKISKEIEETIYEDELTRNSLDDFIEYNMKFLRKKLSEYYHQSMKFDTNNINRTGLIKLIEEENYAFSYLYNSIQNILSKDKTFGGSTEKLFNDIANILSKNILCNYRRILNLYSINWLSLNEINKIQILPMRVRVAPSFLHHSYAIIVTRLLREWNENVNEFVGNIEGKFY